MFHDDSYSADDNLWSLLTHAQELLDKGQVRRARLLITQFVERKRIDPKKLPVLAALYLRVQMYDRAEQTMQRALTELGHSSDLLSSYGLLLASIGRAEESRQWLEAAYQLDDQNAEVLRNLAFAVHRSGARHRAYELLAQAHQEAPLSTELRLICGTILEFDGKLREAACCFRDVVEICQMPEQINLAVSRLHSLKQEDDGLTFEEVVQAMRAESAGELAGDE